MCECSNRYDTPENEDMFLKGQTRSMMKVFYIHWEGLKAVNLLFLSSSPRHLRFKKN